MTEDITFGFFYEMVFVFQSLNITKDRKLIYKEFFDAAVFVDPGDILSKLHEQRSYDSGTDWEMDDKLKQSRLMIQTPGLQLINIFLIG